MPYVKVMDNVLQDLVHVAGDSDVPVWDKCSDDKVTSN